ncbi:MAG: EamA family transporter [Chloroflexi bacterium]|nr:EamA family transporter [Chloroflexota bacterium]
MSEAMVGILLGLLGAFLFGSAPIFTRLGLQYVRTTTGVFTSLLVGSVLIGSLAIPLHAREMLSLPVAALLWIALLGLLNFPLGRYFNFKAVRLAGVARATPILSTSTLFAVLFAIIFIDETPTLLTLIGGLLIVGGVVSIVSERK